MEQVGMVPFRAILIAGPTASGKSALAIRLAHQYRGVVVNADSMQVYRDLRVLSARPDEVALADVPHELYGHVDAAEAYSVGRWMSDVEAAIAGCRARGSIPVVTGGTGLYFKALLEGLSPIPPVPNAIRERWRARAREVGAAELHVELAARDPLTAAGLRPSDTQRLTRALEVLEATGRGLADWQKVPGRPLLDAGDATLKLVVSHPREVLHARADERFDRMIEAGALAEVEALAGRGLSPELPAMRALGVAPLLDVLKGRATLEQGIKRAKIDTRQYIKRQATWLGRNMIAWRWCSAQ